MAHIVIKLETTQAQLYRNMLDAMETKCVPSNPEFQAMVMDLKDKITNGFMDMPHKEFTQLFPDSGY